MAKKGAQETPFREEQVTPGRLLHRLRQTEVYGKMFSLKIAKGETPNIALIKALLQKNEILRPIINFVKGTYDLDSAKGMFREKLTDEYVRYRNVEGLINALFEQLAEIIKAITKRKLATSKKVAAVIDQTPEPEQEPEPAPEPEPEKKPSLNLKTFPLEKKHSDRILGASQIKVKIIRDGKKKPHVLDIIRNDDTLEVTCPTSDKKEGKELTMKIEKGEEWIIGIGNTKEVERLQADLDRASERVQEKQAIYDHHIAITPVSEDAKDIFPMLKILKGRVAGLKKELAKAEANPLLNWFTKGKSPDISDEHIIVEFTDNGVIVVTDEGEKCKATLQRIA
jgi:hypothetical protein